MQNKGSLRGVQFTMFIIKRTGFQNAGSLKKGFSQDFKVPGGLVVKNLPWNARDEGLLPSRGTETPHGKGQLSSVPQPESPHAAGSEPMGSGARTLPGTSPWAPEPTWCKRRPP